MSPLGTHLLSFSSFQSVNCVKQYWCQVSETFVSHFDKKFAQKLLLVVRCQDCMIVLYLLYVKGSHLNYRSFGTTFILPDHMWIHQCFVNYCRWFAGIVPKFQFMQQRRQRSHFDIFIIEGFMCFKTIVILKKNLQIISAHLLLSI